MFGPGSEFGSENLLLFLNFLPSELVIDPKQVRHTFGFGIHALHCERKLLPFIRLLTNFGPLPAPHNRQVEGSSPSGPTILLIIIGFL